jgi:hypothetical protein
MALRIATGLFGFAALCTDDVASSLGVSISALMVFTSCCDKWIPARPLSPGSPGTRIETTSKAALVPISHVTRGKHHGRFSISTTGNKYRGRQRGESILKKPRYQFLSKKQQEAIDWANPKLLLEVLESGDVGTFNTIVGVIQDLKDVTGHVSEDQERCLQLPNLLFEAALREK